MNITKQDTYHASLLRVIDEVLNDLEGTSLEEVLPIIRERIAYLVGALVYVATTQVWTVAGHLSDDVPESREVISSVLASMAAKMQQPGWL